MKLVILAAGELDEQVPAEGEGAEGRRAVLDLEDVAAGRPLAGDGEGGVGGARIGWGSAPVLEGALIGVVRLMEPKGRMKRQGQLEQDQGDGDRKYPD